MLSGFDAWTREGNTISFTVINEKIDKTAASRYTFDAILALVLKASDVLKHERNHMSRDNLNKEIAVFETFFGGLCFQDTQGV